MSVTDGTTLGSQVNDQIVLSRILNNHVCVSTSGPKFKTYQNTSIFFTVSIFFSKHIVFNFEWLFFKDFKNKSGMFFLLIYYKF